MELGRHRNRRKVRESGSTEDVAWAEWGESFTFRSDGGKIWEDLPIQPLGLVKAKATSYVKTDVEGRRLW